MYSTNSAIFGPFNPFFSAATPRVVATLESKRSHRDPGWNLGDVAVAPPKRSGNQDGIGRTQAPGACYKPMHRRSRVLSGVVFTIAINPSTASLIAATEWKKPWSMTDRLSQPQKASMRFIWGL